MHVGPFTNREFHIILLGTCDMHYLVQNLQCKASLTWLDL